MKKLALAAMLAGLVGTASAQNVTIYGLIDLGYGSTESVATSGGAQQKSSGMMEGSFSGNRLGFRASEDLGGGTTLIFQLESAINVTQSSNLSRWDGKDHQAYNTGTHAAGTSNGIGTSFNRQSYVGVRNAKFGEIRAGMDYPTTYSLGLAFNAGTDNTRGGDSYLNGSIPSRAPMVTYTSPKIGPTTFIVQAGRSSTDYNDSTVTDYGTSMQAFTVRYDQGRFSGAAILAKGKSELSSSSSAVTTRDNKMVVGRYDFGRFVVLGSAQDNRATTDGSAPIDYKNYQVGVQVPFGKTVPFAQIGSAKSEQSGAMVNDRKLFQTGVLHNMSKRTTLYAVYGSDNEAVASTTKYDWKSYRVGVRHTF